MKDVPGFEGRYAVTEDGKVWSYPKPGGTLKGKWIKSFEHYKGYLQHYLTTGINNQRKIIMTHRVVALTYLSNPLGYKEINHIDGNKKNNHYSNLEWCSRLHNMRHAAKMGVLKHKSFEEHPMAKLTKEKVTNIRELWETGNYYQRELAEMYSVNQRCIWGIIHRKIWNF